MKSKCLNYLNSLITENTTKKELDLIDYIKKCVKEQKEEKPITAKVDWLPYFEKLWKMYPRKINKEQAKKTFEHKIRGLTEQECKDKCNAIYKAQISYQNIISQTNKSMEYIMHYSTFLNANVPNSPHYKGV